MASSRKKPYWKQTQRGVRGCGSLWLARKFGVSKPVILGIINGTGWRHVL